MSNRRRLRGRPPAGEPMRTLPRYRHKAPALGTVRGWLHRLEAAGDAERKGLEHTGKPGRPAVLWGLTEKGEKRAADNPAPEPLTRDEARKLLHEACRDEFGISGRQFVRRLDAGFYECGWKCRCTTPHDLGLRAILRGAAWSRMSVARASAEDAGPSSGESSGASPERTPPAPCARSEAKTGQREAAGA
jgi:hypothetical protein